MHCKSHGGKIISNRVVHCRGLPPRRWQCCWWENQTTSKSKCHEWRKPRQWAEQQKHPFEVERRRRGKYTTLSEKLSRERKRTCERGGRDAAIDTEISLQIKISAPETQIEMRERTEEVARWQTLLWSSGHANLVLSRGHGAAAEEFLFPWERIRVAWFGQRAEGQKGAFLSLSTSVVRVSVFFNTIRYLYWKTKKVFWYKGRS